MLKIGKMTSSWSEAHTVIIVHSTPQGPWWGQNDALKNILVDNMKKVALSRHFPCSWNGYKRKHEPVRKDVGIARETKYFSRGAMWLRGSNAASLVSRIICSGSASTPIPSHVVSTYMFFEKRGLFHKQNLPFISDVNLGRQRTHDLILDCAFPKCSSIAWVWASWNFRNICIFAEM